MNFCLCKVAASPPLLPPTVQSKAINPIISNTLSSHPRTAAHAPAVSPPLQLSCSCSIIQHTAVTHTAIQFNRWKQVRLSAAPPKHQILK